MNISTVALYNEIDPFAAAWLRELIKAGEIASGVVDERDIRELEPDYVGRFTQVHFFAGIGGWSRALRLAGWPDSKPVWTGSCPCQPFSAAGRGGGGFADDRHLWPAFFAFIQKRRPGVVFGEQVASRDGIAWLDLVSSDLEGEGYACGPVVLPACGVGAPHIRQRLFFVADAAGIEQEKRNGGAVRRPPTASTGLCQAGKLGDASGAGSGRDSGAISRSQGAREEERKQDRRQPHEFELAGEPGGVGDPDRQGRQGDDGAELEAAQRAGGAVGGFWAGAEWVFCRDGKNRPVEPGSFPLAHGIPARVGRLRGYGNAINAEAAATFIRAYKEVRAA